MSLIGIADKGFGLGKKKDNGIFGDYETRKKEKMEKIKDKEYPLYNSKISKTLETRNQEKQIIKEAKAGFDFEKREQIRKGIKIGVGVISAGVVASSIRSKKPKLSNNGGFRLWIKKAKPHST